MHRGRDISSRKELVPWCSILHRAHLITLSSFNTSGYCVWFCPHPYTVQEKYRYVDSLPKGGHPDSGAGGLAMWGEAVEWGRFIWEKWWLWGHPAAALTGGDRQDVATLCPAVHGRRAGGTSQAEAWGAQAGNEENFPHQDSPAVEPKPRQAGPLWYRVSAGWSLSGLG